jgi:glyoxylase-like metal-dependent hydrolase (beta-lactamase superfamily II)
MIVKEFFDTATFTLTFAVYDPESKDAVIIDPVLDYEPYGSTVSQESAERLLDFVKEKGLKVHYILETHAHADHLTSAQLLRQQLGAKTAIHKNIAEVQKVFQGIFNFKSDFDTQGKVFDHLFDDSDVIEVGSLKIKVLHTPGHTPACVSFLINDEAVFTGDALFMPDYGTGRCDFPEGSAEQLYDSITQKLYTLPDDTAVYVGHDYQPGGRPVEFKTTIGESKKNNIHLNAETSKKEFIKFREARDSGLMAPRLLLASIQVNAQNGIFPKREDNGLSYLKIPVKGLPDS